MYRQIIPSLALFSLILLVSACGDESPPATSADQPSGDEQVPSTPSAKPSPPVARVAEARPIDAAGVRELEWDALIPDDYRPDALMQEYNVDELEDDDPRSAELMAKLRELWDQAPVREDLEGATIKLPGFVVPLEGDAEQTTSFLLVPYYGACVHVPPPPANQTVYVLTEPGKGTRPGLFDVVWVTGTMSVKRTENDIAEAGYTLYATDVTAYE